MKKLSAVLASILLSGSFALAHESHDVYEGYDAKYPMYMTPPSNIHQVCLAQYETNGQHYSCGDIKMVREHLCPPAEENAKQEALSDCEGSTGHKCEVYSSRKVQEVAIWEVTGRGGGYAQVKCAFRSYARVKSEELTRND